MQNNINFLEQTSRYEAPLKQIENLKHIQKLKLINYHSSQRNQMNKTQTFRAKNFGQPPKSDNFGISSLQTRNSVARKNYKMLDPLQR